MPHDTSFSTSCCASDFAFFGFVDAEVVVDAVDNDSLLAAATTAGDGDDITVIGVVGVVVVVVEVDVVVDKLLFQGSVALVSSYKR